MKKMRRFRLHWRDGQVNEVSGVDIADAMRRAGYGAGSVAALDYHEEIKDETEKNKTEARS